MSPRRTHSNGQAHRFGGHWTDQKLEVLAGYLRSYTTALQRQPTARNPFRKAYIDAFAGTGYRAPRPDKNEQGEQGLLFPDLADDEPQRLLDGSPRIALQVDPPFDKYIFVERDAERCVQLETLKDEFAHRRDAIDVIQGDANDVIQELSARNWRSHRAVLFLDPYGMQVEWKTIEAVAATKAIDMSYGAAHLAQNIFSPPEDQSCSVECQKHQERQRGQQPLTDGSLSCVGVHKDVCHGNCAEKASPCRLTVLGPQSVLVFHSPALLRERIERTSAERSIRPFEVLPRRCRRNRGTGSVPP
jgi:hypothetical protein